MAIFETQKLQRAMHRERKLAKDKQRKRRRKNPVLRRKRKRDMEKKKLPFVTREVSSKAYAEAVKELELEDETRKTFVECSETDEEAIFFPPMKICLTGRQFCKGIMHDCGVITMVKDGSVAEKKGVQKGWKIITVDGQDFKNLHIEICPFRKKLLKDFEILFDTSPQPIMEDGLVVIHKKTGMKGVLYSWRHYETYGSRDEFQRIMNMPGRVTYHLKFDNGKYCRCTADDFEILEFDNTPDPRLKFPIRSFMHMLPRDRKLLDEMTNSRRYRGGWRGSWRVIHSSGRQGVIRAPMVDRGTFLQFKGSKGGLLNSKGSKMYVVVFGNRGQCRLCTINDLEVYPLKEDALVIADGKVGYIRRIKKFCPTSYHRLLENPKEREMKYTYIVTVLDKLRRRIWTVKCTANALEVIDYEQVLPNDLWVVDKQTGEEGYIIESRSGFRGLEYQVYFETGFVRTCSATDLEVIMDEKLPLQKGMMVAIRNQADPDEAVVGYEWDGREDIWFQDQAPDDLSFRSCRIWQVRSCTMADDVLYRKMSRLPENAYLVEYNVGGAKYHTEEELTVVDVQPLVEAYFQAFFDALGLLSCVEWEGWLFEWAQPNYDCREWGLWLVEEFKRRNLNANAHH